MNRRSATRAYSTCMSGSTIPLLLFSAIYSKSLPLSRAAASFMTRERFSAIFGKFMDSNGRSLLGIRRSSSFKGVLKQKPRLVSLVSDELRMVEDDLFRLDNDFDVLVDDEQVCILRVAGFELIGGLQDAVKEAAAENVQALGSALPFVDISAVDPGSFSITTARQLAAVKQQQLSGITLDSLRDSCDENEVPYSLTNGKLEFGEDGIGDLLDVLDRRLYTDGLVPGSVTRYKAGSRHVRT